MSDASQPEPGNPPGSEPALWLIAALGAWGLAGFKLAMEISTDFAFAYFDAFTFMAGFAVWWLMSGYLWELLIGVLSGQPVPAGKPTDYQVSLKEYPRGVILFFLGLAAFATLMSLDGSMDLRHASGLGLVSGLIARFLALGERHPEDDPPRGDQRMELPRHAGVVQRVSSSKPPSILYRAFDITWRNAAVIIISAVAGVWNAFIAIVGLWYILPWFGVPLLIAGALFGDEIFQSRLLLIATLVVLLIFVTTVIVGLGVDLVARMRSRALSMRAWPALAVFTASSTYILSFAVPIGLVIWYIIVELAES